MTTTLSSPVSAQQNRDVDEFAEAEREYAAQGQGSAFNGQSQSYEEQQEVVEVREPAPIDLRPLIRAAEYGMLPMSCESRLWLPSGRTMDDWNIGVKGMTNLYRWAKEGGKVNSDAHPYRAEHIMDREKTDMEYTAEYMHMTGAYAEIVAALSAGVKSPEQFATWKDKHGGRW